uniref:TUG ubiquitin-like domain-containing protein n=1 Tax=Mola mola TaxID=94237 RepID=A0A3Q3WMK5_MOLML
SRHTMASSGMSVTVLTPNGRRQTVKVFPNTPLLQVSHLPLLGRFQRTTVDLTLPWRFANLPNNAKLEMVTSARKQAVADTQVRIALQMGDGSRLQDSFSCGQSLWEVVTHFPQIRCLSESGSTPVCVYMRDEVSGAEALKTATLKSLGLTGGSAIIRFLLKNSKTQGEEDGREPVETDTMAYQPKVESSERPEDDGEKAGPSGLNAHPVSSSPTAPSAPFIPFSGGGQRLGGPVAGAGGRSLSSSASSSLSALTAAIESPKAKKPIERNPLIYHCDLDSFHSEDDNLPDEFFEVTVDDIRKRFAQLKSERKLLEEAPLMTKTLREAQMKEKMERYPKVVLRVQFPDRHVLQGFFRPLETGVCVRIVFTSAVITPPKTILDDPSATLFQVGYITNWSLWAALL